MKTAVDSSVLLDVLGADPVFGEASREADALLTRDRGFFRRYFRSLKILSPAA